VVTSGLDGIFPKGIMIGEVTRVTRAVVACFRLRHSTSVRWTVSKNVGDPRHGPVEGNRFHDINRPVLPPVAVSDRGSGAA